MKQYHLKIGDYWLIDVAGFGAQPAFIRSISVISKVHFSILFECESLNRSVSIDIHESKIFGSVVLNTHGLVAYARQHQIPALLANITLGIDYTNSNTTQTGAQNQASVISPSWSAPLTPWTKVYMYTDDIIDIKDTGGFFNINYVKFKSAIIRMTDKSLIINIEDASGNLSTVEIPSGEYQNARMRMGYADFEVDFSKWIIGARSASKAPLSTSQLYTTIPKGISINYDTLSKSSPCSDHLWIDTGMRVTYCKHCDAKGVATMDGIKEST